MPPSPFWNASWIGPCDHPIGELGVFLYRCSWRLDVIPNSSAARVSADNRYKLYVNGEFVGFGPQRGDEKHWFFETWDIAPFLKAGENVVEALVWNFGRWAPMAQHTVRTGFVCEVVGSREGETPEDFVPEAAKTLNTPGAWQVARVEGWTFDMMHSQIAEFYIDIGPGEIIDARTTPSPCTGRGASLEWHKPHHIAQGNDRGAGGGGVPWMLVPRSIPPMRYVKREAEPVIRKGFLGDDLRPDHTDGGTLPDGLKLACGGKLLLDFQELLCAFPRVRIQGPEGASVVLTYAEALWQDDNAKGNRDVVAGKRMRGYQDKLVLSGGADVFEPLWWRTFRYLLIEVEADTATTQDVSLLAVDAIETGYPLQVESSFEADDSCVKPIWDVSVRTAERCAGEHYFDCPYYEQLQYVGDTRIQVLIGYYLGRDRALTRNAVETLGWSIMENGLTQSRYPSRQTQVIPPFSLWWLMMVYDQMLYDDTPAVSADSNRNVSREVVVQWLQTLTKAEPCGFWQFADWVPEWTWGVPPGGANATVNRFTGFLAILANTLTSEWATYVHTPTGENIPTIQSSNSLSWSLLVNGLRKYGSDKDWLPSEHAEALYRVHQLLAGLDPDPWPEEALAKANAAKCTYYFSYYKHLAMFGRPEEEVNPDRTNKTYGSNTTYFDELAPWREMIESGLTTFAETPEPVRSDCHAWSAHPILGFFQIVAGVTSTAPGWKKAQIMPHPGKLKRFDARIAHSEGELRVAFENGRLAIDTPVPATLLWKGKRQQIKPGRFET